MKSRLHGLLLAALAALQVVPLNSVATDLSNVPMAIKNTVQPNVMFTLDDSGSMQFEVIPENDQVYLTFPRPTTLYGSTYYDYGTFDRTARFDLANRYSRCYRNAACNNLYYDPAKRYLPWSNADGSLMDDMSPAAACHNPYKCSVGNTEGTIDLTTDHTATRYWVNDNGSRTSEEVNYYPATYFRYTGPGAAPTSVGAASNIETNYLRIQIKPGVPYPKADARTDCGTDSDTTCTYEKEIQNFANWYSYYRSRILAARAGVGRAFGKQGNAMRVGFGAINKGSETKDGVSTRTVIRGVRSFTGTDRSAFFAELYGHTMPTVGTPLRRALDDVGKYYSRTDDTGPWGQYPGVGGGTQFACRQNYNILMTDGYWNGDDANTAGARLNVDNTNGTTKTSTTTPVATYTYTAGNPFSDAYADTLADVAMYYWVNDLRPLMAAKIVPRNAMDPAFWPHMVNFTVGLGVYGTIPKTTIDAAFTAIGSNTTPPTIVWPEARDGRESENVDDLAHAALNSRGNFFSTSDPDTFAAALTDALEDIIAREGSAAAVAVANANVSSGDNAAYASSYNSGTWTGNLNAFALDLTTGVPLTISLWTSGSAQAQLDLRTAAVSDRFIATYSGTGYSGAGRQFQPAAATIGGSIGSRLSAAQEARLNTPLASDGANVVAYLRGDRSGETTTYRTRAHLLGDIINAEPVVIRPPERHYFDSGYSAFKVAQKDRSKMVVQGANDGMVHVFNATTGAENWAYVPNLLIDMDDPANSGTSVLNTLSRKTYAHRPFVDATPFAGDVDFSNTDGVTGSPAADWHTILVGGLGKGGRGVYALDMTTPDAGSESGAANKVLWEFPNATTNATVKANVGYVFGRPFIVKTKAKGWVVLVASGYNNGSGSDNSGGDGHAYLFVLNARTGELIKAIDTTVGSATDTAGMAHLAAFVDDADYNNTVSHVYAGDLKGNVWRFDLSDAIDYTHWTVKRLAILKDGVSGTVNTQPVTTEPQFAMIKIGGVFKRLVYVGTGQYLGDSDVPTSGTETVPGSQKQTFYGLVDDLSNPSGIAPVIADNLRSSLQVQTFGAPVTVTTDNVTTTTRTATDTAVDYTTVNAKKGWYIDLQDPGAAPSERVSTNPALVSGALIFTTNIPNSDACVPGGSSWLNVLDYKTGGVLENSSLPWSGISLGDALASRPVIVRLPAGAGIRALTRTSAGATLATATGIPIPANVPRRGAWREIPK
jgi:type IV pilus assembly protein PilY1